MSTYPIPSGTKELRNNPIETPLKWYESVQSSFNAEIYYMEHYSKVFKHIENS